MDKGAWWATVHGVTKSRTQLKQLSAHAGALRSYFSFFIVKILTDHSFPKFRSEYDP